MYDVIGLLVSILGCHDDWGLVVFFIENNVA